MTELVTEGKKAAELLAERADTNVLLCYQCKKCTTGCPLSEEMDIAPHKLMRLLQLGRLEQVLRSKTVWLCASCQTCSTRCPSGIDIAGVMDSLKILAQQRGVESPMPHSPIFIKAGMRSMRSMGRMYELGMMLEMNLKTGQPLKDADLGMKMLKAGHLRIIPERAGFPRKLKAQPPASDGTIAYYPGCSLHASASQYDKSFRAVARALGLKLKEPKGWLCCGSSLAHWSDADLAVKLPLMNLSLVESSGHSSVTVPCAMCFSRLKHGAHHAEARPEAAGSVNALTGYEYKGNVEVENSLQTVVNRVGLKALANTVKRPLKGIKVACYYGCLLTRPPKVTDAEHPEYPTEMDEIVETLGGAPVAWSYKTECCGGSLGVVDTQQCVKLVEKITAAATAAGADAVVTACPMCHANLDGRQSTLPVEGRVPVFYFTQLMALALGLGGKAAAAHGHIVDTRPLLVKTGLQSE